MGGKKAGKYQKPPNPSKRRRNNNDWVSHIFLGDGKPPNSKKQDSRKVHDAKGRNKHGRTYR